MQNSAERFAEQRRKNRGCLRIWVLVWILAPIALFSGVALLFGTAFAWDSFMEWRWKTYPNTCPFAAYLPSDAVFTECKRTNAGFDYMFNLEVNVTREGYDAFMREIMGWHPDAKVRQQDTATSVSTTISISGAGALSADFDWENGKMSGIYARF